MQVQSLGLEDALEEEEMATHSSILAWEIPWTEEPGGLQSLGGPQRVRHDLMTKQQLKERWPLSGSHPLQDISCLPESGERLCY